MQNPLSEFERSTLLTVLNRHLGKDYPVEIILFGSMLTGKVRPTSDIDIAVKSDSQLDKATWQKIEEDFENSLLPRKVDVVDYWRITPEFRKIIDESGEVIIASKSHPYRLCPVGHHWISTHLHEIPPSESNPAGGLTEVDGHCRRTRGQSKDSANEVLTSEEIKEIFKRFGRAKSSLLPIFTDDDKKKWNRFDDKIVFWTDFWNAVLRPKEKLDPKLVKALIGSESSFNLKPETQNAGSAGKAMGLIQLTEQALRILHGDGDEVKNHMIEIQESDLEDPDVSISAGIRWLFHKKKLAEATLRRDSSWDEAVINYKGYLLDYKKDPDKHMEGMNVYRDLLKKF